MKHFEHKVTVFRDVIDLRLYYWLNDNVCNGNYRVKSDNLYRNTIETLVSFKKAEDAIMFKLIFG